MSEWSPEECSSTATSSAHAQYEVAVYDHLEQHHTDEWYIGMCKERTIISSVLDMSAISTQQSLRCLHDVRSGIIVGRFHNTRIRPLFLLVRFNSYAITNA